MHACLNTCGAAIDQRGRSSGKLSTTDRNQSGDSDQPQWPRAEPHGNCHPWAAPAAPTTNTGVQSAVATSPSTMKTASGNTSVREQGDPEPRALARPRPDRVEPQRTATTAMTMPTWTPHRFPEKFSCVSQLCVECQNVTVHQPTHMIGHPFRCGPDSSCQDAHVRKRKGGGPTYSTRICHRECDIHSARRAGHARGSPERVLMAKFLLLTSPASFSSLVESGWNSLYSSITAHIPLDVSQSHQHTLRHAVKRRPPAHLRQ